MKNTIDNSIHDILYNRYRNQRQNNCFINICDDEHCYVYYDLDDDVLVYTRRLEDKVVTTKFKNGKLYESYSNNYIE